jgi:hypothetical protein
MRARQRHLNPKAAGATLVLDARLITGLSDGTGVQTWSDASGGGNDATQTTSGFRPLYKTAVQGGQPGVLFDGTDDSMATAYAPTSGDVTVFALFKPNTPPAFSRILDKDFTNGFWFGKDGSASDPKYGGGCRQTSSPFGNFLTMDATTSHVMSGSRSSTTWTITDETKTTSSSTVSSTAFNTTIIRVGITNANSQRWKGHIFAVSYFHNLALSSPLLSRMFHAYGFSYKIASS